MAVQENAIRAIEAQQAGVAPRSPQWMVGEQLKDICRREPGSAALIAQDLEREGMEKLTARAVEEARSADRERIAAMEKQLAAADGDVAAFRVHYEAWQDSYNKMSGYLAKISGRDPERAGKLKMAVQAVAERWGLA